MLSEIEVFQLKKYKKDFQNIITTMADIEELIPESRSQEMDEELDKIKTEYEVEILTLKSKIDSILKNASPLEKMIYETIMYETSVDEEKLVPTLRKYEPKVTEILSNEELMENPELLKALNILLSKSNEFVEKEDLSKASFFNSSQVTLTASFVHGQLDISEITLIRLDELQNVMTQIDVDMINGVVKYYDYELEVDDIEFLKDMDISNIIESLKKLNNSNIKQDTQERPDDIVK